MSADYRLNWTQPIGSLGPLVKKQEPERVCEFREFETKIYTAPEGDQPFDGMTAPTQHTAAPPSTGKWVEHDGGPCPEEVKGRHFQVRFPSGREEKCGPSDAADWLFMNDRRPECNVVAYRVLP